MSKVMLLALKKDLGRKAYEYLVKYPIRWFINGRLVSIFRVDSSVIKCVKKDEQRQRVRKEKSSVLN